MLITAFLATGIILLVLQTTVFTLLPGWLGRPDLLFLLVVFIACHLDLWRGAVLILLIGLLQDIFSGVFLGLYPVINLLVFIFIKGLSRQLAINEFSYQIPLALVSYLFLGTGMFVFATLQAPDNPPLWSWRTMLLQLILLAVFALPAYRIFYGVMELTTRTNGRGLFKRHPGNRFTM